MRIIPPKQRLFVAEYLVDKNGKAAAIRAGYSPGNAKVRASKLLAKPEIQALLEKSLRRQEQRVEVKADEVLASIKRIAEAAETAEDFANALKGNELLGKHLKLFTDKVELSGRVTLEQLVAGSIPDEGVK